MRYRCFVVCPFGNEEGSETHRRLFAELSGLYEHIFDRAAEICRQSGAEVQIIDGRADRGRRILGVTQQGIDAADAVIVVLTADNPNVFLELAWAEAMWHDPIPLKSDEYTLPIDISNLRCIPFTPQQAAGRDSAGATRVARLVADEIMQRIATGKQHKPFDHWPETTIASGGVRVYNRFLRGITIADWSSMLQDAEEEIIVASSGMSRIFAQDMFWQEPDRPKVTLSFGQLLLRKARRGVAVTVLMYHEDNVTVDHMKRKETDLKEIKAEFAQSFTKWATLRDAFETEKQVAESRGGSRDFVPGGSLRIVQLHQRYLPYRITFTEKRVLLTLRFYTEMLNSGLCIDAAAPTGPVVEHNMPVHMQVREELQYLIDQNEAQSEHRYQEWRNARRA